MFVDPNKTGSPKIATELPESTKASLQFSPTSRLDTSRLAGLPSPPKPPKLVIPNLKKEPKKSPSTAAPPVKKSPPAARITPSIGETKTPCSTDPQPLQKVILRTGLGKTPKANSAPAVPVAPILQPCTATISEQKPVVPTAPAIPTTAAPALSVLTTPTFTANSQTPTQTPTGAKPKKPRKKKPKDPNAVQKPRSQVLVRDSAGRFISPKDMDSAASITTITVSPDKITKVHTPTSRAAATSNTQSGQSSTKDLTVVTTRELPKQAKPAPQPKNVKQAGQTLLKGNIKNSVTVVSKASTTSRIVYNLAKTPSGAGFTITKALPISSSSSVAIANVTPLFSQHARLIVPKTAVTAVAGAASTSSTPMTSILLTPDAAGLKTVTNAVVVSKTIPVSSSSNTTSTVTSTTPSTTSATSIGKSTSASASTSKTSVSALSSKAASMSSTTTTSSVSSSKVSATTVAATAIKTSTSTVTPVSSSKVQTTSSAVTTESAAKAVSSPAASSPSTASTSSGASSDKSDSSGSDDHAVSSSSDDSSPASSPQPAARTLPFTTPTTTNTTETPVTKPESSTPSAPTSSKPATVSKSTISKTSAYSRNGSGNAKAGAMLAAKIEQIHSSLKPNATKVAKTTVVSSTTTGSVISMSSSSGKSVLKKPVTTSKSDAIAPGTSLLTKTSELSLLKTNSEVVNKKEQNEPKKKSNKDAIDKPKTPTAKTLSTTIDKPKTPTAKTLSTTSTTLSPTASKPSPSKAATLFPPTTQAKHALPIVNLQKMPFPTGATVLGTISVVNPAQSKQKPSAKTPSSAKRPSTSPQEGTPPKVLKTETSTKTVESILPNTTASLSSTTSSTSTKSSEKASTSAAKQSQPKALTMTTKSGPVSTNSSTTSPSKTVSNSTPEGTKSAEPKKTVSKSVAESTKPDVNSQYAQPKVTPSKSKSAAGDKPTTGPQNPKPNNKTVTNGKPNGNKDTPKKPPSGKSSPKTPLSKQNSKESLKTEDIVKILPPKGHEQDKINDAFKVQAGEDPVVIYIVNDECEEPMDTNKASDNVTPNRKRKANGESVTSSNNNTVESLSPTGNKENGDVTKRKLDDENKVQKEEQIIVDDSDTEDAIQTSSGPKELKLDTKVTIASS